MKPTMYMRTCGKCQDPCALKFIPKHDPSHDHEDHHMIMHLTGQPHVHAMRPSPMMGMYKPMPMMIPPMPNYMMKQKPGMTSSMRSKMPGTSVLSFKLRKRAKIRKPALFQECLI